MESHNLSGVFADRYTIERTLGRGASATVYLAHDSRQDREIALKVLDYELAHALGAKRFLQEIHITSRLQHPHILPIHDSGEWNELLYYVLPFVAGESLRARLERENQLPIDECVRLTCDIASALAHAHSKGVIHRDVKPENILLSDGHALIADFGIARTVETTSSERLTSSGLIVGTSQYMSPEQASGEREIDARSDIYSLGCVLYEMLAGMPPFVGPNVQAIIAQRFTHAPRAVTMFRPTVPEHLVEVLDRALAISPADRFQNMKAFEAALPATPGTISERRRPGRKVRDLIRTRRAKMIAAASLASVILGVAATLRTGMAPGGLFVSKPKLDSSLYLVVPGSQAAGFTAETSVDATERIAQTLERWGLRVVPSMEVDRAINISGKPQSPEEAELLARQLGAGRMLRLARSQSTPGIKLYNVATHAERRSPLASADSAEVDRALMELLRDPARPAVASGGDGRTSSFAAWKAYEAGHIAMKRWDIPNALASFDRAATIDPEYAPARLWKAQLMMWKSSVDSAVWIHDAEFAAARAGTLDTRDGLLARGLNALAHRDYPGACAEYRKLADLDSLDFIGWHGLGECQSHDEAVLADRSSPSGWRFRTSRHQTANDYLHALRLQPGAHSIIKYETMEKLLPIGPAKVRGGTDSKGAVAFLAYPSLDNDTLAFVPYPRAMFASIPLAAISTRSDAIERNANVLFQFATSWTRADERNSQAFEGLALVSEARGDIFAKTAGNLSASGAVAKALQLSTDPVQKVRLAAMEVRLRLKRGEFGKASYLADSILRSVPEGLADKELLSLSAFAGRSDDMASAASRPGTVFSGSYPPELLAMSGELFARAALGDCAAAALAEARLVAALESYVAAARRDEAKQSLLTRSYGLLVPCTNGQSALKIVNSKDPLHRLQQLYSRKDIAGMRAITDSLSRRRRFSRPGDLSLDYTFQEAWAKAASGDTAGAVKQLDLALNALPTLSAAALKEPGASAAVGRAMLLRADLAYSKKDVVAAKRWANAVVQLWGNAQGSLKTAVNRMRAVAR